MASTSEKFHSIGVVPKRLRGDHVNCKNHAEVNAEKRCIGCAEPYCTTCTVEVRGQTYCADCKKMALTDGVNSIPHAALIPSGEAKESLTYALVGLLCFGIILGPMAISKGIEARKQMALNPQLTGWGKANAGIAIGSLSLVFWILGKFAGAGI
jgi:hypothetical protein